MLSLAQGMLGKLRMRWRSSIDVTVVKYQRIMPPLFGQQTLPMGWILEYCKLSKLMLHDWLTATTKNEIFSWARVNFFLIYDLITIVDIIVPGKFVKKFI